MKTIAVLVFAISAFMFSCNQPSNKEVKDAKQNLTKAKDALQDAQTKQIQVAKAKEIQDWNRFQIESDSSIVALENDLKKLELRIENSANKNRQDLKAAYDSSKGRIEILRDNLHKRNVEFERNIEKFDKNFIEKNQSFKREFTHDMDEFGKSVRDLFKDNVK